MLHLLLRNRYLFAMFLGVVWIGILLVPRLAKEFKERRKQTMLDSPANVDLSKRQESSYIRTIEQPNYLSAGAFYQDKLCMDTLNGGAGKPVGVFQCHGAGRNQFWYLLKETFWLRNDNLCIEGPSNLQTPGPVLLRKCAAVENQAWAYENEHLQLSGSTLCLQSVNGKVILKQCNPNSAAQNWKLNTPPGF